MHRLKSWENKLQGLVTDSGGFRRWALIFSSMFAFTGSLFIMAQFQTESKKNLISTKKVELNVIPFVWMLHTHWMNVCNGVALKWHDLNFFSDSNSCQAKVEMSRSLFHSYQVLTIHQLVSLGQLKGQISKTEELVQFGACCHLPKTYLLPL